MYRFLKHGGLFGLPFLLVFMLIILVDPFKLFFFYSDYYPEGNFVVLNREVVTGRTYRKYYHKHHYDSFIFGSSRSLAFKCKTWKLYLDASASPFHFDGFGEGIYDVRNKVVYIDRAGQKIRSALFVLDDNLLSRDRNGENHLTISLPAISGESRLTFYHTFIKVCTYPKFMLGFLDYSLFRQYRPYMHSTLSHTAFPDRGDSVTCDFYLGNEAELNADPDAYYRKIEKVFYERAEIESDMARDDFPISQAAVGFIRDIKTIFDRHQTDYQIVISPTYDQKPMSPVHRALLNKVFGASRIHDYSGAHRLSESTTNFYDVGHYRTHVANEILKDVYGPQQ